MHPNDAPAQELSKSAFNLKYVVKYLRNEGLLSDVLFEMKSLFRVFWIKQYSGMFMCVQLALRAWVIVLLPVIWVDMTTSCSLALVSAQLQLAAAETNAMGHKSSLSVHMTGNRFLMLICLKAAQPHSALFRLEHSPSIQSLGLSWALSMQGFCIGGSPFYAFSLSSGHKHNIGPQFFGDIFI